MKPYGVVLAVWLVGWGLSGAWGVPASPFPFEAKQPDGTGVVLFKRGDEGLSWVETPEGYSVVQNPESGFWEYARRRLVALELFPGGVEASAPAPAGLGKHLRPLRFDRVPASPDQGGDRETVTQPGGETLVLVRRESGAPWRETLQGYTVVKNRRTGGWEYARRGAVEILEPSGTVYRPGVPAPAGWPRHERPSGLPDS